MSKVVHKITAIPKSLAAKKVLYEKAIAAYYGDSSVPIMPDAVYDRLEDEIRAADPQWPRLHQTHTAKVAKKYRRELEVPCPSLDKFYPQHQQQIVRWVKDNVPMRDGVGLADVSTKLDGSSIQAVCEGGRPVRLSTRNSKAIDGFLPHIPASILPVRGLPDCVIRFEAVVPYDTWKEHYSEEFDSARVMASAVFNRNDVHPAIKRGHVHLIAVRLQRLTVRGKHTIPAYSAGLDKLDELGFMTVPRGTCRITSDVATDGVALAQLFSHALTTMIGACEYECDGIVLHNNRPGLEITEDRPDYAKAFKVNAEDDAPVAEVVGIIWSLTRTGRFVPKAKLKPVQFDGVTVQHATMNNAQWAEQRKLGPGAQVRLVRSGEIIPKIIEVVKPGVFMLPDAEDFGVTSIKRQGVDLVVDQHGEESAAQSRVQRFTHAMKVIGMEHFAASAAGKLADVKKIKSPLHLLSIMLDPARSLETCVRAGISEKVAARALTTVPKRVNLWDLMYASGVFNPGLGRRRFVKVCELRPVSKSAGHVPSYAKGAVEGALGPVMASHYLRGHDAFWLELSTLLSEDGAHLGASQVVQKPSKGPAPREGGPLSGQVVYMTGYRDAAEEAAIIEAGGTFAPFGSKTTILLHRPGGKRSGKLADAANRGVRVCQFADLGLGGANPQNGPKTVQNPPQKRLFGVAKRSQ